MKTAIISILILIILSGFVAAKDLSDYPEVFIEGDNLSVKIVAGDDSSAVHALAQTQIVLSLTQLVNKRIFGITKLASEVEEIDDLNIISIGNACENEVTAEILQNPDPCDRGLEPGKATIEFFETETGKAHIILNALSDNGINKAVEVLINYEDYNLNGDLYAIELLNEEDEENEDEDMFDTENNNMIGTEEQKQKIIDELNKKMKENENIDEEKQEVIIIEDEKVETEQEGPQPILKEEDNLIKKIIAWFLSLFR